MHIRHLKKSNEFPLKQTHILVDKLKKRGLPEEDIGIITPYALQLNALQNCHAKNPGITIGTVEDFQGKN